MDARAFFSIATAAVLTSLLGCSTTHTKTAPPTGLPANSQPLEFAVYRLTGDGRELLAQGKLNYTLRDIDVLKWGNKDGHPSWKKSLKLMNGFRIGTLVARTDEVSGFGLWIQNDLHPAGFSWEWFEVENGGIYRKLQGEGRVRVTQSEYLDGMEIRSVEFLTDITLRFQEDVKMGPKHRTHEVVVSKGSVLRFAP